MKHREKRILLALLLLLVGVGKMPLFAQSLNPDSTASFYKPYPFIRFVDGNDSLPSISDDDFFHSSAKVTFPVNKIKLPTNSLLLHELENVVIPQLNRDSMQLLRVRMRGAASPEGPYRWNRYLGEHRGKALLTFLTDRLQVPVDEEALTLDNDIEDYRTLCQMMRNNNDSAYTFVQTLTDAYLAKNDPAGLKAQLKQAQGGRLWRRIFKEYFPALRSARVMLFFRRYPSPLQMPPLGSVDMNLPFPQPVSIDTVADLEYRRELLSVKTNLLFYGAYIPGYNRWCPIPNIAVEYYPAGGHFTFGASLDIPWWQHYHKHKFFQIRNWQVEARYYLRSGDLINNPPGQGAAFRGFYVQGYAHAGVFGICFDKNRGWVGEGGGAGVGAGYVLPLTKRGHWRLEFAAQVGYFRCSYDPYQYENLINTDYHDDRYYYKWDGPASAFKRRQYRWNWFGPTRVGVTLSYDILYRRNHEPGISFKSTERRRKWKLKD